MPKEQTNFFYLLIALIFVLVTVPLADDLGLMNAPLVRGAIFSAVLLVGVWSLRGNGVFFAVGMTLAMAGVVINLVDASVPSQWLPFASMLSMIAFLLVAIAFTLRQVTFGTEINLNRLVGAVCVYLLLGVIWALGYTVLGTAAPGSFTGFEASGGPGWNSEWLYFSFITMTTVGYGDILPVSATARALAYLQAVVGQFYLAVLVAGLVGAYVGNRQKDGTG